MRLNKKSRINKMTRSLRIKSSNIITEDDRDYLLLSKNQVFYKITELLELNRKVICNLHDRNGTIGYKIISIENLFDETCKVIMKETTHNLHDKFLYNLIYNSRRNEYSIIEQDEYFEKIEISK